MTTLNIMFITWLLTVGLIPFTVRTMKDAIDESQKRNPTSLDSKFTIKVVLAIPFLGTALLMLLWYGYFNDQRNRKQ